MGDEKVATYMDIQDYVEEHFGYKPKSCWIAHVKEIYGLPLRIAWNRAGEERKNPCPPGKVKDIESAFRYFRMID
jgi:hypothetical protein